MELRLARATGKSRMGIFFFTSQITRPMISRIPNTLIKPAPVVVCMCLAVFLVSGCMTPPPKAPENVCGIFDEKRNWYRAAQRARDRWKSPVGITMSFIYQESGFRANSRPERKRLLGVIPWKRKSSAKGYAQAIDATWKMYVKDAGDWFPDRTNFEDAVDFVGWYNYQSQKNLGISRTDAKSLYLAYHEGWRGYRNRTYEKKLWLIEAANRVEIRARQYQTQYLRCKNKLRRWYDFLLG